MDFRNSGNRYGDFEEAGRLNLHVHFPHRFGQRRSMSVDFMNGKTYAIDTLRGIPLISAQVGGLQGFLLTAL